MRNQITYKALRNKTVAVYVNGKRTGTILNPRLATFLYRPMSGPVSKPFSTMESLKRSLEAA